MINLFYAFALVFCFSTEAYSQGFMEKVKGLNAPAIKEMIKDNVSLEAMQNLLEKNDTVIDNAIDESAEVTNNINDTQVESDADIMTLDPVGNLAEDDSDNFIASDTGTITEGNVDDDFTRAPDFYDFPSLFFTTKERETIDDARNFTGELYQRYVKSIEDRRQKESLRKALEKSGKQVRSVEVEEREMPDFDERFITLQGIMFSSADHWTVWINGVRMEPGKIPTYIADLKVTQKFAEFKWYDEYTNKVIPLRLRSLERFHIDSRTFFKGG